MALVANLPRQAIESSTLDLTQSRWRHARHVDFLDNHLVRLAAREYQKLGFVGLIIEEPPRHGKSELASHYFPSWYLGTFPDHKVILASYEADFAATWGRKVRDTTEEWGRDLFSIQVDRATRAADEWNLAKPHAGGMKTAGIRGSITGRGGNLIIVDDPLKNREEANSEAIRERIWSNFTSAVLTRREVDFQRGLEGIALIIGTRWHEDDLIGRIVRAMEEDDDFPKFLRIRLPAIAEEPDEDFPEPDPLGRRAGEALWPEKFDERKLQVIRATSEEDWASLYQQRPAPKEGYLFKEEWFEIVTMPSGKWRKKVRFWDTAATEEKPSSDPDWTVGLLLGLHSDGHYYVLDVVRFRESPGRTEQRIKEQTWLDRKDPRIRYRVAQEPASQGKLYIRHLARTVFRGLNMRGFRETGSKAQRADVVAGDAERGDVKIVRGKWNREFLREVKRFPFSTHDDQVDALSGAHQTLTGRGQSGMSTW